MKMLATVGLAICWGAFALTWLAGALYNQSRAPQAQTRAGFGSAFLYGAVVMVVASRVVPQADWQPLIVYTHWVRLVGLVILLIATAFTLWARFALGAMWSAAPTVKQEHKLRTSGPYGVTRHPIYTGILAMLLGTLLLAAVGRWILLLPVFVIIFEIKLHVEERLMLAEFPDDYPRYREQVPQLIPGLRLLSRRRLAPDQRG